MVGVVTVRAASASRMLAWWTRPSEQAAGCLAAGSPPEEAEQDVQGMEGWECHMGTEWCHRTGFHQCRTPSPADVMPSVSVVLPWGQGDSDCDRIVRKFIVSAVISVTVIDVTLSS